jgi:hypothetical protein
MFVIISLFHNLHYEFIGLCELDFTKIILQKEFVHIIHWLELQFSEVMPSTIPCSVFVFGISMQGMQTSGFLK